MNFLLVSLSFCICSVGLDNLKLKLDTNMHNFWTGMVHPSPCPCNIHYLCSLQCYTSELSQIITNFFSLGIFNYIVRVRRYGGDLVSSYRRSFRSYLEPSDTFLSFEDLTFKLGDLASIICYYFFLAFQISFLAELWLFIFRFTIPIIFRITLLYLIWISLLQSLQCRKTWKSGKRWGITN